MLHALVMALWRSKCHQLLLISFFVFEFFYLFSPCRNREKECMDIEIHFPHENVIRMEEKKYLK